MTETPAAIPRAMRGILSLEDLEPVAERFLPNCLFQFVSGGVETNASLRENRAAFQDLDLYPQVLVDVSKRTTETSLFGETYSAPFGIAPMGGSGLSGFRADLAFAQAARLENIPFILSGASLIRMEEIAEANPRHLVSGLSAGRTRRHRSLARPRRGGKVPHPCGHRRRAGQRQSREPGTCRLFIAASPELPARLRRAQSSALAVRHRATHAR